jgi:hypothetical protein
MFRPMCSARKIGAGKLAQVADLFKRAVVSGNQGGVEELVAGIGNRAWMNQFAEQNQDVFEGIPEEYLTGFVMEGIMGGIKAARDMPRRTKPRWRPKCFTGAFSETRKRRRSCRRCPRPCRSSGCRSTSQPPQHLPRNHRRLPCLSLHLLHRPRRNPSHQRRFRPGVERRPGSQSGPGYYGRSGSPCVRSDCADAGRADSG